MEKGLVHIYCGDGKGKTTAAFGLAFRCAGRGGKVLVVQFLKGGETGEILLAQRLPSFTILRGNAAGKFSFCMNETEKQTVSEQNNCHLEDIAKMLQKEEYQMLVLDEVMAALNYGMLDWDAVLSLIDERPAGLEVVMTGRNPPQELIERADYISEIKKVRHPYEKGVAAREGIEL